MSVRPVDLQADIGEILLTEQQIATKVAELGARITADYAGRPLTLVSVLKGSLPFMADLMRAIDLPAAHRPHGGQLVRRQRHRVVGPRAHPQGPVGEHRGRGRPDRRGHHRHRPDPQLPDPLPARQEPARPCGSARSSTSPLVASSRSRSTTSGSRSPTSSSSATASTTARSTATCASSACSSPRSTGPGRSRRRPSRRDHAPAAPRRWPDAGGHRRGRDPRRLRPAVVAGRPARRPAAAVGQRARGQRHHRPPRRRRDAVARRPALRRR